MGKKWDQIGQPDLETMLTEIAANDTQAATLARAVWEQISPAEQEDWREQLAAALLSYRGPHAKSRIGEIATKRLARLGKS